MTQQSFMLVDIRSNDFLVEMRSIKCIIDMVNVNVINFYYNNNNRQLRIDSHYSKIDLFG